MPAPDSTYGKNFKVLVLKGVILDQAFGCFFDACSAALADFALVPALPSQGRVLLLIECMCCSEVCMSMGMWASGAQSSVLL